MEYETEWKESLTTAIKAAKEKFSVYYGQTGHVRGEFYAVATILDPYIRMNAYNPEHWEREEQQVYQEQILQFYKEHYEQYESDAQIQASRQHPDVEVIIPGNEL